MFRKDASRRRLWRGRAVSLFLTAALLLGMAPGLTLPASADHWADPYLDQLVDWGVIRADQAGDPDAPITRAEFMAVVNRAYGYTEMGPIPFTDVSPGDWYYDDVAIAYTAGYMKGTSETTASPNASLTREQAVCILGRNMMLKETPGEDLAFADSRSISGWARGMIKTAVNNYIVNGYPDDTFRPQTDITKGQMAALMTQCVGLPISESGVSTLGDVSGNVTITAPNVTLRGTTISGDLYISGGVGLGSIKLENVNVLGRIIVSGTGESEGGSASVIMRNVTANELLVDNMRKKYVTVRADGITEIAKTTVRTNAYLEDNNTDDKGLMRIELDGGSGTRLDLAGRIKKVVDKTPNSFVQMAKGSAQSITVDEEATNSVIQINRNTEVKELNLDVAARVNGEGDVGRLNINAPGSTVTMLPDNIYIRPGITGNVNGVVMDSAAAEESSLGPRLLSGYPAANDLAPTALRADFSGNKKGTVYWGVSSVSDGSIGASDLISPPSYGSKAVRGGSLSLPTGDTVGSAKISGLTVGGSYYLSAVLVDGQGERSPVKVISFTTPDNTVPAFAQGYPYMSLVSDSMAQVTVMPTKTCKLYYAVLLKGAKAPTANELRSAAVTGNLGYGVVDVVKNTERVINVSNRLQELKDYTLYLLLSDVDGGKSSAVTSLQFKTVDKTAPEFDPDPDPNNSITEATSVKLTAGLNEPGTIYWVAVEKGKNYPPPNNSSDPLSKDNIMSGTYNPDGTLINANGGTPVSARLDSEYAKNQVKNHKNASIYGSVRVAKADTEVTINVTKLKEATDYDFYYVAQDSVGNFSRAVKKITIRTKDTVGPVVTQYFRDMTKDEAVVIPKATDEVVLKFNEDVKVEGMGGLLDLKKTDLEKVLKENFKLYYIDDRGNPVQVGSEKNADTWVDYGKVVVRKADDGIEVALQPNSDPNKSAVKLLSGREYYFELGKITDLSENPPKGLRAEAVLRYDKLSGTEHVLPRFTVAPASVKLSEPSVNQISVQPVWVPNLYKKDEPNNADPINKEGKKEGGTKQGDKVTDTDVGKELARVDGRFFVDPESTREMGNTYYYDILLFSEKDMDYDVYYRVLDPKNDYAALKSGQSEGKLAFSDYQIREGDTTDNEGWAYLGNVKSDWNRSRARDVSGVNKDAERTGAAHLNNLRLLNTLGQDVRYEFAISVTKLGGSSNYEAWGDRFQVHVSVIAGARDKVDGVIKAGSATEETVRKAEGISVISDPFHITLNFSGFDAPPVFTEGPTFKPAYNGAPTARISFGLDNPGTLFYLIAPKNKPLDETSITTKKAVGEGEGAIPSGKTIGAGDTDNLWQVIAAQTGMTNPGKLNDDGYLDYYSISAPAADRITTDRNMYWISYDRTDGKAESVFLEYDEGMEESKEYYIYIVLGTDNSEKKSNVYIYNFTSGVTEKPRLELAQPSSKQFTVASKYPNGEGNIVGGPSRLNWKMFHQDQASQELSKPFDRDKGPRDYPGVVTLLDALTTTFESSIYGDSTFDETYNGFTVFDVLASDVAKRDIWYLINEGNDPLPYGSGKNQSTKSDGTWSTDWLKAAQAARPEDEFIQNQTFLILVGGRHPDSADTQDYTSFRILQNVSSADLSAPVLKNGNIREFRLTWDSNYKEPIMSGSINLEFDSTKPVYWRRAKNANDPTYYRVVGGFSGYSGSGDSATVGLLFGVGTSSPFTGASAESSNYVLEFEGASRGSNYPLLPGWGLFAKNGSDPGTGLQISFSTESRTVKRLVGETEEEIKQWRGKCTVKYSHTVKGGTYSAETEWYDEDILKNVVARSPAPKLDSVGATPSLSYDGSSGKLKLAKGTVELNFDGSLYFRTSDGKSYRVINGNSDFSETDSTVGVGRGLSSNISNVTAALDVVTVKATLPEITFDDPGNTAKVTILGIDGQITGRSENSETAQRGGIQITVSLEDMGISADGSKHNYRPVIRVWYNGKDYGPIYGAAAAIPIPTAPAFLNIVGSSPSGSSDGLRYTATVSLTFDQNVAVKTEGGGAVKADYVPAASTRDTGTVSMKTSGSSIQVELKDVSPGRVDFGRFRIWNASESKYMEGTLSIEIKEEPKPAGVTMLTKSHIYVTFNGKTWVDGKLQ